MSKLWGDATVTTEVSISAKERLRITLDVLKSLYQVDHKWEDDEIVEYTPHYHGSGEYRVVKGKVTSKHRAAMVIYKDLKGSK